MELSIVIPVYNEESSIGLVVQELIKYLYKLNLNGYEVVIVDDGSTDNTGNILKFLKNNYKHIRIVTHKFRRGIGEAIKTALKNGRYEWIFLFPGDGQADPEDIGKFLSATNIADLVIGYREKRADPRYRYFTSDLWRWLIYVLFGIRFKDINWIKLIKKHAIDTIPIISKSAFIDAEILLRAKKIGYKIIEIPSNHRKRVAGKTKCFAFSIVTDALKDIIKLRKTVKKFHGSR